MRRECLERFLRHRPQRKPLVSGPGMQHGTCVMHVPWCMSGSVTRGGGENVPGIPGACATLNFSYLVRGPWNELESRCQQRQRGPWSYICIYLHLHIYASPYAQVWACICMHGKKRYHGIVYYCIWLWICSRSKLAKWFGKYMTIERANICLWVLLSSFKKSGHFVPDNTAKSAQNMNLTTERYIVTRWQSLYRNTSG